MAKLPSLRDLLDAGVHFGHRTSRWHPRMEDYIFMSKNGVHVINLEKTEVELEKAVMFLAKLASEGKTIVFVGTKKQAGAIVQKAAIECGMPYVNFRWIGGTLTNFDMVRSSAVKYKEMKDALDNNTENLSKKELSKIREKVEKGDKLFGGLVNMTKKPDAFIVIGAHDEKNTIKEATIEGVPVIALVDTNSDPTQVEFPIPANDDATKSIELFADLFARVIKENKVLVKKN